nr:hypothetical protein [uncultured Agathobaculum sp.]
MRRTGGAATATGKNRFAQKNSGFRLSFKIMRKIKTKNVKMTERSKKQKTGGRQMRWRWQAGAPRPAQAGDANCPYRAMQQDFCFMINKIKD